MSKRRISRYKKRDSDRSGFTYREISMIHDEGSLVGSDEFDAPPPSNIPLGGEGDGSAGESRSDYTSFDTPSENQKVTRYITAAGGINYSDSEPYLYIVGSNNNVNVSSNPYITTAPHNRQLSLECVGSSVTLAETITNTLLQLHCDGEDGSTTFLNRSPSEHTVTVSGNAQVDASQKVFGSGSLLLDGTGDYLTSADSVDWTFGLLDFTIDCHIRFSSVAASQTISSHYNATGNQRGWIFIWSTVTGLSLQYSLDGISDILKSVTWAPSADTWYHVAVVRNGNNLLFFVDGTQQGTTQDVSGADIFDSNSNLEIGVYGGTATPFTGWIDEFRISKVARWTSNFDVPDAAYSNTSGLVLKENYKMDSGSILNLICNGTDGLWHETSRSHLTKDFGEF